MVFQIVPTPEQLSTAVPPILLYAQALEPNLSVFSVDVDSQVFTVDKHLVTNVTVPGLLSLVLLDLVLDYLLCSHTFVITK